MRITRVLAASIGTVLAALAAAPSTARADDRRVLQPGGGLPALSVEVDLAAGVVRTRTCPHGSPCDGPAKEVKIDLPKAELPAATAVKIDVVAVGDAKHVAHVRIPSAADADRAFEVILAANDAPPIFAGVTGLGAGSSGDRSGMMVTTADRGDGTRSIVVARMSDSTRICGRATPLDPSGLDPKTLELRRATLRLPKEVRDAASPAVAARAAEDAPAPLVSPLSFAGTSGGKGSALVDGDPATAWIETRPNDGRGEFVTLRSAAGVSISRLRLVVAPQPLPDGYAAPRTFFVVTNEGAVGVTMPEDAALHPGAAYDVPLPKPIASECVSIVLDDAYSKDKGPNVGLAEVLAFTQFDEKGKTLDDLALQLRGGGDSARAAVSLLGRTGKSGLSAIENVFPKLDADARMLALDAAAGAPCEDAAPVLAHALTDADKRVGAHAEQRLERCGKKAGPALARVLGSIDGDAPRLEQTLATVAPDAALAPIGARLGRKTGAQGASTRKAFALAARNAAPAALADVAQKLASDAAKLEFFRAVAPRAGDLDENSKAAIVAIAEAPRFESRWLVAPALGTLAAGGDVRALTILAKWIASAEEWPLRARAAEVMPANDAGRAALVRACADASPRVREAVLARAREPDMTPLAPCARTLVASDPWPFVKVAAAHDLAFPADPSADDALASVLVDPSVDVRVAAARGLGARRAISKSSALLARLTDTKENHEVRREAARALGHACATSALAELTHVAKDAAMPDNVGADVDLGMAAVEALGMIHPPDLRARLASALDPKSPARAQAAAAHALEDTTTCGATR